MTFQIKRGPAARTPKLADGELCLQTDAGKVLIGNGGENLGVAMDTDLIAAKDEINSAIAGKAPASHTHTADQVGARPNTWVPSKWDVGLGNVDNTPDSQKSVNYANSANYANTAGNANALGGIGAGDFYRSGNKPFVCGVYTGNGVRKENGGQTINLGFAPSAVMVERDNGARHYSLCYGGLAINGQPLNPQEGEIMGNYYGADVKIVSNGFTVNNASKECTNEDGVVHYYIAFI